MEVAGTGKRVRIYIGEQDKAEGGHDPLWQTLLYYLQKHGAAGATMFRGLAGFGAHSRMHMARLADVLPDLPVLVEWIDGADRVERLLPHVREMVHTGTITCEDVEVVKYTHRAPQPLPPETVGDVMTKDVLTVRPETPLGEAVRALLQRDYRALPVVDGTNRLVGIVTNSDLVERGGLTARLDLLGRLEGAAIERELADSQVRSKSVGDVMTTDPVRVTPDERLDTAAHTMVQHGLKRLPVVDSQGKLLGVLSRVDLLRTMGEDYPAPLPEPGPEQPSARTAGEVMRHDVPAVRENASLGEVLDAVTSTRLNRAIVVDAEGRVVGVISDADLLERLDPMAETGLLPSLMRRASVLRGQNARAMDMMRTPPVTVTAETPLVDAVRLMLGARRKVLPITDGDGHLRGTIDRSDLLRHLERP